MSEGGLTSDGFVMRYVPTHDAVDGIGEREGVFLPCSFWLVEALALAGQQATRRMHCSSGLLTVANDVGLYAEEYDPHAPRLLGNFPQAFTHLALVAAAHTLEPETFAMTPPAARPLARLLEATLTGGRRRGATVKDRDHEHRERIEARTGSRSLIHGYGADERDLGGLVTYLDPDGQLAVVLPRGKYAGAGHAGLLPGTTCCAGHRATAPTPKRSPSSTICSSEQAEALGLDRRESIVGGFSQGGGLALGLALQRSDRPRPKAALAMSPAIDTAAFDLDEENAPPVLVQHGTNDPLIPVQRSRDLARQLAIARRSHRLSRVPDGASGRAREPARREPTGSRASTRVNVPTSRSPTIPIELVPSVTTAQWEAEVLRSELPVIVDFWAPWCGPCKQVSPIVETIAAMRKGFYKVVKVNIDEEPKLAEEYGVQSIPMIGLVRNGRLERASVGAKPRPQLEAELGMLVIP